MLEWDLRSKFEMRVRAVEKPELLDAHNGQGGGAGGIGTGLDH